MTEPLTAEDLLFPDTLAPEVRRNYLAGWGEYTAWCTRNGVPALPADPEIVAEFIRWLGWEWTPDGQPAPPGLRVAAGKGASSLERALQAIGTAHRTASAIWAEREMPALNLREAWAVIAERKALGSPRGPGRPRLGPAGGGSPDPLTAVRDAALGALMATGEVSALWLAALTGREAAVHGSRVETWRGDAMVIVRDPAAAEAVADWLAALAWSVVSEGPLFPRIRAGKVTDEPLLANEIAMIAREWAAAG
jgi:hypothetical protein